MISWPVSSLFRPVLALAAITVLWVPLSGCSDPAPKTEEPPKAEESAPEGDAAAPEPSDETAQKEEPEPVERASTVPPGRAMVSAANPLAVEAGLEILRQGGTAVDAALAVQAVLGLVEPQSSGIGGGAFSLVWAAEAKTLETYDGRETAPVSVTPDLFLDEEGNPVSFRDALLGGKAVGVPGVVAMMDMMHKEHGKLPLETIFAPAIKLAEDGFAISPRLHKLVAWLPFAKEMPDTKAYFFDEAGEQHPIGHILKNPAYAETLRLIAGGGAEAFYSGEMAKAIVDKVQNAPVNPAGMTVEDLAAYTPKKRDVLCGPYRAFRVCSMPPPTSGGILLLQTLAMLERFDLPGLKPGSVEAVHLISEASRLSYADRDLYAADADFVAVPVKGLLDTSYLEERSKLIDPSKSMGKAAPGEPPMQKEGRLFAPDTDVKRPGTSHFSIIDSAGNIVSMTTTIQFAFGSHMMVGGFLLNNELTDFSFRPEKDGKPVANAVAPGKRPRSSMTPTLVFDAEGNPVLAMGSPGGSRIPAYVLQAVIGILDWGLSVQEAVSAPHHLNRNGATELEKGTAIEALKEPLEALGHEVLIRDHGSGLHGFRMTADGIEGGADPRREGIARGL